MKTGRNLSLSENLPYYIHLMVKKTLKTPIFMLYLHRVTYQNDAIQWIINNLNADLILGIRFIPKTSFKMDASATVKIPNKEVKANSFLHGLPPWEEEASRRYHSFDWGNLSAKIFSWVRRQL